jgi:tRNA(His) guanylyltransferase
MAGKHDDLGDRMKAYEAVETDRLLDPHLPIYARIDGRSFSAFTRGMERPFDARMTAAMVATTKHLVEDTLPRIAYTQSDEISLVWLSGGDAQPLFGGKVHKLTSVLASLAAAAFQLEIRRAFGADADRLANRLPHFDARVCQLPSKIEAANAILWRALDARKNAVSMATRAHFSAKAMHGKNQSDMRAMLHGAGVEFEDYPNAFKRGTFLRRVLIERGLTDAELARIPEAHRPAPGTMVTRSAVQEVDMPPFNTVTNRVEVIFDRAEPVVVEGRGLVAGERSWTG